MINVSAECRAKMQTNTKFLEYVTITLTDDTELTIPQSDLIIQGNGIVSGAGANAFPLGEASARTIRLEIANFDDKYSDYDFYGASIGLVVKYQLAQGYETFYYGYYTVVTPETRGTTIKITAVDDMYKADKPYTTSLTFPQTALAVYTEACQTAGIAIQTATFTNDDFVIQQKPDNCTFRQVIAGCAMLAGGNAYINREGRLEIKEYDLSALENWLEYDGGVFKPWETGTAYDGGSFNPWNTGAVLDGDTYQNAVNGMHILYAWIGPPNVDTDDIVITGIKTSVDSQTEVLEGTEGYVLSVENPLIIGKEAEALALIGDIVIGLRFRQFSGEYIGDPTIEFMDPCIVVDRKGNTYGSFVTDTDYSFRGKTSIKNSAEPKIRTGMSYPSSNTKTLQKAREIADQEISAYDLGVQTLGKLITQALGFYETKEVDANGSVIQYMHDKPTLALSTIIWKKTANAFAVSTDGGQTWGAGMDAAGNAVLNTLAVRGLSADWINTGLLNGNRINAKNLSVSDTNSNVTFAVDNNGNVTIRATNFSLAGKSIDEIAKDADNLLIDSLGLSSTYWTLHGTITRNQADPYGGTNAIKLVPLNDEGYLQAKPSNNNPFKTTGVSYKLSVWLKSSGVFATEPIKLYFNNTASVDIDVSDEWQEYTFDLTVNSIAQSNDLVTIGGYGSYTSQSGFDLYIYNPRVTYSFTQDEIFNALTNNGTVQGIYMQNGLLYINGQYVNARGLSVVDNNNNTTLYIDSNGNVTIRATSFSLAGKGIDQMIDESLYTYDPENFLTDSLGLTSDYWTLHGTITRNQTDPYGGTDAIRLTPDTDEGYVQAKVSNNNPFKVTGVKYRLSVWLKASNSSGATHPINLYLNRVASGDIYPTTEWQEYSTEVDVSSVAIGDLVTIGGFGSFTSSDGYSLYVYNPRVTCEMTRSELFGELFGGSQGVTLTPDGRVYFGASAISVQDLYALNATIGGFVIDSTSIRNNSKTSSNSGSIALSINEFTRSINSVSRSHLRFAIGSKFGITSTGNVYAANGEFEGKVEASSGKIACMTIGSSTLTIKDASDLDSLKIKTDGNNSAGVIEFHNSIGNPRISENGIIASSGSHGLDLSFYSTIDTGVISSGNHEMGNTEFYGWVQCDSSLTVSGTKSIKADTENYGGQLYYCYETPTPMLGDVGSGVLDETGMCIVSIDDIFAESTDTTIQYQVFLQKCGNGDLWVESKDPAFFVVRGTPNLAFDWEIKAKQKKYTQYRYNNDEQIVTDYHQDDYSNTGIDAVETVQQSLEETENVLLNEALSDDTEQLLEGLLFDELEGAYVQ